MATRYRLPDSVGGGEVVDVERDPALQLWGHPAHLLRTDDGIEMVMQRRHLIEVKPPLPEEPPAGSVVLAQLVDEDRPWVWERMADHTFGEGWYTTGDNGGRFAWSSLCTRGNPVLLVPDPFAEPVELPWKADTEPISVLRPALQVEDDAPIVRIAARPFGDGEWRITPVVAREMAAALMAAAAAAEKEQS